jgi:uncharacterized protein YbjT (DUF2867 family)
MSDSRWIRAGSLGAQLRSDSQATGDIMKKRTVLVTAASGNAGRNIVEALLTKDFNVVATSRDPGKLSFSQPVERRAYDANAAADFDQLFHQIDDVVLVGPPLDGRVHEKLAPFIEAAAQKGIGHIVYISGNYLSGMTGRTLEDLPIRKVEKMVISSGLKHTIVRAGFFMDNFTTGFYASMVDRGAITLATGDGKSSLVAASDVGEFVAEALGQGLTGEYLVTGPEALDHYEVARLLSTKMKREITYTAVTEEQLLAVYTSKGLPAESVEYGLTLYRAFRNQTTAAVTDGFRQATGREPLRFATFLGLD